MYMAMYSWMPVQYMAETVRMVCDEEVKVSIRCVLNFCTLVALLLSSCYNVSLFVCLFVCVVVEPLSVPTHQPRLQGVMENISEHFWRIIGMPGMYVCMLLLAHSS
jgi:hypothetical protein